MNTETKEKPRVKIPDGIAENVSPEILAKLQSLVDRIADKSGQVEFVKPENMSLGAQLSRMLEQKLSDAIGGAISEVLGSLPPSMNIDILSKLLAVAAAADCKTDREREMVDLIMLKFENDFYTVRKVVLADQAEDQTAPDADEINRRAEGRYEPGTGADA